MRLISRIRTTLWPKRWDSRYRRRPCKYRRCSRNLTVGPKWRNARKKNIHRTKGERNGKCPAPRCTGNRGWRIPSTVSFECVHSQNSTQLPPRFVSVHLITVIPPSPWTTPRSIFFTLGGGRQDHEAKGRGSNEWRRRKERMSLPLKKHDRPIHVDKKALASLRPPFIPHFPSVVLFCPFSSYCV